MTKSTPPPRKPTRRPAAESVEISTYPVAVRFLHDRVNVERMRATRIDESTFKLDRMRALMDAMNNPQDQVRMVHVAGTVGKGSTVAMIASLLEGAGYAVGQYTSPHLVDVRERISINGQLIGKSDFTDLVRQVANAAAAARIEPTFFEMMTAMAFKHFAEQAVDIAVVEVGLGGRLDSTNIIKPVVSVVTAIDFDHMHLLGNTLEKIAAEKAGIFKPGVPAMTHEQTPEIEAVLRSKAAEVGAPFQIVGKDVEFSRRFGSDNERGPHSRVCLITPRGQYMHLPVPLAGEHQAVNCALSLAVVDHLRGAGFDCNEESMLAGLDKCRVPGRMEMVWTRPRILVDGAHNPASLAALMRSVGAHIPYDSMVCIFGCCEDKDVGAMLDTAARGGDKIIFTKARGTPRAVDPEDLQRLFNERCGKMCQVAPDVAAALDLATRAVGRDDLICVTGSFYLVGDAKKYLSDLDRKRDSA